MLVRAYTYIRALGPEGLKRVSETAVLNANYVMEGIRDLFPVPYDGRCMHEFVASATPLKEKYGVRALDVAKRLLDYGVHPPTTYFPLIVDEALMIEPTETESREDLDRLIAGVPAHRAEAETDADVLREAPLTMPVRRLDEAGAARHPVLRQRLATTRCLTARARPPASGGGRVSVIKVLPELRANGAAQMALDQGLLEAADEVVARRYTWAPPALSLGRFQKWDHEVPKLPFDVVRRPSGGRAVLHGEEFEWSFAFAFPPGSLGEGARAAADVARALRPRGRLVRGRAGGAGRRSWTTPAPSRTIARPSASPRRCGTTCSARGEKLVAVAQARAGGRVLVHGSVLERRPPEELTQVAETLLGEPWQGEGLAGAGYVLAADMIWKRVLVRLEAALRGLAP